jgi:hypothetical protein
VLMDVIASARYLVCLAASPFTLVFFGSSQLQLTVGICDLGCGSRAPSSERESESGEVEARSGAAMMSTVSPWVERDPCL